MPHEEVTKIIADLEHWKEFFQSYVATGEAPPPEVFEEQKEIADLYKQRIEGVLTEIEQVGVFNIGSIGSGLQSHFRKAENLLALISKETYFSEAGKRTPVGKQYGAYNVEIIDNIINELKMALKRMNMTINYIRKIMG